MRQTIFCKHYPRGGMFKNATCSAGVSFIDSGFKTVPDAPCFWNRGDGQPRPTQPNCVKCEFPSDEEIAAKEAESNVRFANIGKARKAIVDHLGGPWTKTNRKGGQGRIDCPVCGAKDSLAFSRAAYNGHIHARCSTAGCTNWME